MSLLILFNQHQRFFAPVAETVPLSELLAAKLRTFASIAETAPLSEAMSVINGNAVSQTESVTVVEALVANIDTFAHVADSLAYSAALAALKRVVIEMFEEPAIEASITANVAARASLAASVTNAEQLVARLRGRPALADAVSVAASVLARYDAHVGLEEEALLAYAVTARLALNASIDDALVLAESTAPNLADLALLLEAVALAELLIEKTPHVRLYESWTLTEHVRSITTRLIELCTAHGFVIPLQRIEMAAAPLFAIDMATARRHADADEPSRRFGFEHSKASTFIMMTVENLTPNIAEPTPEPPAPELAASIHSSYARARADALAPSRMFGFRTGVQSSYRIEMQVVIVEPLRQEGMGP